MSLTQPLTSDEHKSCMRAEGFLCNSSTKSGPWSDFALTVLYKLTFFTLRYITNMMVKE